MWLSFGERFEIIDINGKFVRRVMLSPLSADDDRNVVN